MVFSCLDLSSFLPIVIFLYNVFFSTSVVTSVTTNVTTIVTTIVITSVTLSHPQQFLRKNDINNV